MAKARTWTCRRCGIKHKGTDQLCACGTRRPPRRTPKHQLVLELHPYDWWVAAYGERCGICGRPPGPKRRLDRDHDHTTGLPRGLLCHRCNRGLGYLRSDDLLRRALTYLARHEDRQEAAA
jgi:hypothetical protein